MLLEREGWRVNHKRAYRLYREEGLPLRTKRPGRRVSCRRRVERTTVCSPKESWSMDFMADELFDVHRIRALTKVDNFTRESVAIEVDSSIGGQRVVEVQGRVAQDRSLPRAI